MMFILYIFIYLCLFYVFTQFRLTILYIYNLFDILTLILCIYPILIDYFIYLYIFFYIFMLIVCIYQILTDYIIYIYIFL